MKRAQRLSVIRKLSPSRAATSMSFTRSRTSSSSNCASFSTYCSWFPIFTR